MGETLRGYLSKWWLFLICIIVCVGCAWLYTKVRADRYTVKANILISQEESQGPGAGMAAMMAQFSSLGSLFGSSSPVDDEVFIVNSHSLLRDVVKKLDIHKTHIVNNDFLTRVFRYKDFPVEVFTDPSIPDTLTTPITFKVKVSDDGEITVKTKTALDTYPEVKAKKFPVTVEIPYGTFILNKTQYFVPGQDLTTKITFAGYDDAVEGLTEDLKIDVADKKANAIAMEMESSDPQYAKDVLNAIIERYNERGIEEKNAKNQKTAEFLDSRLALLTQDLDTAEHSIERFKKANGITDIEIDAQYQMALRGEIEKQMVEAGTNLEIIKVTSDFIADPANAYSLVPMTTVTADAAEAIQAYNELVLKRIDLSQKAHGNNAGLQSLDRQIDAMRKNINVSLKKAYESAKLALREVQNKEKESNGYMASVPALERQYRNIERQRTIKEQLYIFLLQRREETAMMLANSVPKGTIIDEAYAINEPLGVKKKVLLVAAFILALFLAPVLLHLRKLFRNKFSSKDELERLTKVPMLGEICTSKSGQTLVVEPGSQSPTGELFRLVRTNLLFVLSDKNDKVVLVTSSIAGEGKTFIAVNLASMLALDHKRTLLVGMDIRNPQLSEYLELPQTTGMTEYLSNGSLSPTDIILKNPLGNGLDIVTAGPIPPNPAELLSSDRVDEFFDEMRGLYDYIIVDSAPVSMVSDTFTLVKISDATVYVCRANKTSLKEVRLFNTLYQEKRLKKMSLVVNGTRRRKGYGYGYKGK